MVLKMGILGKPPQELKDELRSGKIKVSVYGMGRVGIPIAVAWLNAGASVIGVDINKEVVNSLNKGIVPFDDEPGVKEGIIKALHEKKFYATDEPVQASKDSDLKIVAVPTTLSSKKFDKKPLLSAVKSIGKGLKKGDVVIIECTVPPLTTEHLIKPILEEESGLKAEEDFGLAFSQERLNEGRALEDIQITYPKVVGGIGPRSTEAVAALYESIAKKGVVRVNRPREAEASKIFEGIYRDVNIALANEFAKFCDSLGIDFLEARRAANTHLFCHIHLPGIGVGGACIPIYPYFLLNVAKKEGLSLNLIKSARRINESMPLYTFDLLKSALNRAGMKLEDTKVGVLGLSYRGGVKDMRLSPSLEFIKLVEKHVSGVRAYDPKIQKIDLVGTCSTLEDLINWSDAIVVATDHPEFKDLDLRCYNKKLIIVDGRNVLNPKLLPKGTIYVGIGRKQSNY